MRVALPSTPYLDPATPGSWSGLPYFIRRSLEEAGVETVEIRLSDSSGMGRWARFLYWRLLRGKRYLRAGETRQLRDYARQLDRQLDLLRVDAVFGLSSWFCAYSKSRLPFFFWTDACFAGMVDFYPSFSRLAPSSLRAGHGAEQAALDRCAGAFYSSEWAARTARESYHAPAEKVHVVPFGGNLEEPPSVAEVTAYVRRRPASPCRLLLVGVEWERKGADIAVAVAELLRTRGLDARLTIVGCQPPRGMRLPASVEVVPFISKATPAGRRRLDDIFQRSHFFLMPTRAEAYGLVFSEAGAFGVPCLATDVGGLGSIITNDVNGRLFDPRAGTASYADYIQTVMGDPGRYEAMALRSAAEARQRLSWKAAGRTVAATMEEALGRRESASGMASTPSCGR